jgi:hypothetical protein
MELDLEALKDPEVIKRMKNPKWRIRNLYSIVDRNARVVPFRPNPAQDHLLNHLHTRNICLKARQRGFSTLIQIAALDQALFNNNFNAGILAHTLDAASEFLKRILFAYENMHPLLKQATPIKQQNASLITFSNGSSIRVDTSMRSGTLQFLHISEFGKISAKFPDKADEVITGTLPALAPTGVGFIESTAEGRQGHFYRMCQKSEADSHSGRKLTPLDWKFHFYSWHDEAEYQLDPTLVPLAPEDTVYFDDLEAKLGVVIEAPRRAWYVSQRGILGEDMMHQEFPSTPEEAFMQSTAGRWYTQQLTQARKDGRIGRFPHDPSHPVDTFWDIGSNDETAIWCMQRINNRYRFIRYFEASGEPFNFFVRELQNMGYTWETHYLPHDAEHKRQQGIVNLSALQMMQDLAPGWRFDVVPKIPDVTHGIQQMRDIFSQCEFDEAGCRLGLQHLENYRKEWDARHEVWRDRPYHGPESNGADSIRMFAQHYAVHKETASYRRPKRGANWRVV